MTVKRLERGGIPMLTVRFCADGALPDGAAEIFHDAADELLRICREELFHLAAAEYDSLPAGRARWRWRGWLASLSAGNAGTAGEDGGIRIDWALTVSDAGGEILVRRWTEIWQDGLLKKTGWPR